MIIPVYKAAAFVSKAVESAVSISEVGEVILVEDGSPDNSFEVCSLLVSRYDNVKLFRHPSGENRGAAESRNLGIRKASFDYVAFLDADDWYLPHRFSKDRSNFEKFPNADACYSCTILEENQHDPESLRYGVKSDLRLLYGLDITPLRFYRLYTENSLVLFDTNSITVRKSFLISDKCFDGRLQLHQDTELWNRLLRRGDF